MSVAQHAGTKPYRDVEWYSSRSVRLWAWVAIVIPPVFFYLLASRAQSSLPYLDDYNGPLAFLLEWKQQHGLQHLTEIVTWQHNEYRLVLLNALLGLQYSVLGHIDLKALAIVGNLFILFLFGALYLVWRRQSSPPGFALLVFVPVSWILFQLQYASAMDISMASLQYFPALLFGILACYFLPSPGRTAAGLAMLCLALSTAGSANGLFLVPIGCVILLQQKNYARLAGWLVVSGAITFLYFHGYNFHSATTHADHNVFSSAKHLSAAYSAAFLGSIATVTRPLPAILLGGALTAVFFLATRDRVFQSNPALYYSAAFILITAIGVSGLRSDGGLTTALGSRYRIHSTLMLILMLLYLCGKYQDRIGRWRGGRRTAIVCVSGLILVAFNLKSNLAGYRFLLMRRAKLETAMLRWEKHEPPEAPHALGREDYTMLSDKKGYYEPRGAILSAALHEGIYRLPDLPQQH